VISVKILGLKFLLYIADIGNQGQLPIVGGIQRIEIGPFLAIAITYHKLAYLYGRDNSAKFVE
jgi:hypothetical protein